MKKLIWVVSVFLSCLWEMAVPDAFAAAQQTTVLPEVVVSAKNEKTSSVAPSFEEAREQVLDIPGGVAVVDSETYKTGRSTTPQDLLGWVPGVYVQSRDTASLESRISIRGSGLQRTFHLRGITLLQDGIPLNLADGSGEAQRIEPLAVDYTEVYRGGNALRYGSTTLGGAINFVTPTGYTASAIQSRFEFGSFGYLRSQLSSGQVAGPLDYYVSLSQFKQDGFRNHTNQDNYDIFTNFGYKFSDSVESRVYLTVIEAKSKLGGALTRDQLYTDPTQANPTSVSQNRKRDFTFTRLASKTTFSAEDQQFDLIGYWSSYDLFHPISPIIYQDCEDWGADLRYTNSADRFGRENRFSAGFDTSLGLIDDDRYNNIGGEPVGRAAEFDDTAYNLVLYGEDEFYLWDRVALVTGGQLLRSVRDVTDYYFPNGDDSGHTTYESVNPKAGLHIDLTDSTRVFFNYNKSFEPPSFSELANSAGDYLPNKGQVSHTLEAGSRGREGRLGWDATYYYSWLDNELLTINTPDGVSLGTINAPSETTHQGIELGADVLLWEGVAVWAKDAAKDHLSGRLVYDWNDFRFNGDPTFGDNQLPSIPAHFFKSELMYEHPIGIYAGPNVEATFNRYPIDMANSLFASPYAIWGFKAGYRTKKGVSFFVEGKNLANKIYASSTGIVANAGAVDTAQFNPGVGRAWFGGVEFNW